MLVSFVSTNKQSLSNSINVEATKYSATSSHPNHSIKISNHNSLHQVLEERQFFSKPLYFPTVGVGLEPRQHQVEKVEFILTQEPQSRLEIYDRNSSALSSSANMLYQDETAKIFIYLNFDLINETTPPASWKFSFMALQAIGALTDPGGDKLETRFKQSQTLTNSYAPNNYPFVVD